MVEWKRKTKLSPTKAASKSPTKAASKAASKPASKPSSKGSGRKTPTQRKKSPVYPDSDEASDYYSVHSDTEEAKSPGGPAPRFTRPAEETKSPGGPPPPPFPRNFNFGDDAGGKPKAKRSRRS